MISAQDPEKSADSRSTLENLLVIAFATCAALLLVLVTILATSTGGAPAVGAILGVLTLTALVTRVRTRRTQPPRRRRLDSIRAYVMKSLALAFTLAVTATAANLIGSRRPSQEDVVSHFREHRQGYETLREMALADGLSSVIDGGTRFARDLDSPRSPGELGISPEDAAAYRRLLAEAECDRLSVTREGEVLFPVAGWGMASRGWRLSVMWSKREPASLVPSIDGLASTGGRSVASHIEGHWYVHFVW